MNSRFFSRLFPPLCMAGIFLLAHTVTRLAENWVIAEAVILTAVLLASFLLPGTTSLWLFLLGTAGTLPVLWALLPPSMFFTTDFWPLSLLFYSVYFVLSVAIATLGPMLLMLLV